MPLTDKENVILGAICGTVDTTLLQSTNYWKNAQQQRLPFTFDPRVLYRGYTANVINNGFCVSSQFLFNGIVRNALTGGKDRELSDTEKIGSGFAAGALSGIICGPIELVMIQQQRKGGSMMGTAIDAVKGGPGIFFRGTIGMMSDLLSYTSLSRAETPTAICVTGRSGRRQQKQCWPLG